MCRELAGMVGQSCAGGRRGRDSGLGALTRRQGSTKACGCQVAGCAQLPLPSNLALNSSRSGCERVRMEQGEHVVPVVPDC